MSFMLLGILNSQAAGGAAGAFDLLETTTLATSASSVTFSGLGAYSDYKHLQIRAVTQSTYGSWIDNMRVRVNGATSSYYAHWLRGTGSSVSSQSEGGGTWIAFEDALGGGSVTDQYGVFVMDILDFANTNKNTTLKLLGGNSTTSGQRVILESGLYSSTNAMTSIEFFAANGDLKSTTRFSLYGIKG